jgi:uncharacterized protein YndB with AHSA1/START domain
MYWLRRLPAPVDIVWETVSTLKGLRTWWIVPPKVFELKPGGRFDHHWQNTVRDFREKEYIDFYENTGAYAQTGGMRFELGWVDQDATMFMFLDTWGPEMRPEGEAGTLGEQAGGRGSPWPGVAAGWHGMMDELERVIGGRPLSHTYEQLCAFYVGYLRDIYRWHGLVQRQPSEGT